MKKVFAIFIMALIIMVPLQCLATEQVSRQKVLYINSYHKGYEWSDDIEKGLLKALRINIREDGSPDISQSSVNLRILRMDTKNNRTESLKKQAAAVAKDVIQEWQPDIVITSDDNAAKYVIVPYYKDADLPFVFCGVNWDASVYGFPAANITGMVEVNPIRELVTLLREYAEGNRIGYIGGNTLSTDRNRTNIEKELGYTFSSGALVETFAEWKQAYRRLQSSADMLIWFSPIGIRGWDNDQAISFILQHTRIPTGAMGDNDIRYSLLGKVGIAEEQGWWAGKTAEKILNGTAPADIPLANNKQSKLYLNMQLAAHMGIVFPMELINQAIFVKERGK